MNTAVRKVLTLLALSSFLQCATSSQWEWVNPRAGRVFEYLQAQEYEMAIQEAEMAIDEQLHQGVVTDADRAVILMCYHSMALAYYALGKKKEAYDVCLRAADVYPERSYYPYAAITQLLYDSGRIEEAYENSKKVVTLISRFYEEELRGFAEDPRMKDPEFRKYHKESIVNSLLAMDDFLQLVVSFGQLQDEYDGRNYARAISLAEGILDREYLVSFGVSVIGSRVIQVSRGSIADLNGLLTGDEILEMDGTYVQGTPYAVYNRITDFQSGTQATMKIQRKHRILDIVCQLDYPELDETKRILAEATRLAKTGAEGKRYSEDSLPPEFLVIEPELKRGIRIAPRPRITVVVLASDNEEVKSLFLAGLPRNSSEPDDIEKTLLPGNVKKYTAEVPVTEGKNTYTIKVVDTSDNDVSSTITVMYRPRRSSDELYSTLYGRSIAVVIGIDEYTHWPPLEFAVSDARAVKDKLYSLGFHRVIELHDGRATRRQILRVLADELPKLLGENDRLFVFFAGHGQTETLSDNSREGYIIPVDGDRDNYRGTSISMSTIRSLSRRYKAKHILYAFDSCYSGLGLMRSGGMKRISGYIRKVCSLKAVQIITAGGQDEQVGEERGHGVFTRYLLLALDGEADLDGDSFVTASEIGGYIRPAVSRKTEDQQTPLYGWLAGEGDFVFYNP